MSISENTVAEAELMAIDEINRAGGLHVNSQRLQIVPIEEDGMSDWPTFARKAARLIDRDQVSAVFGGWTSASRKQCCPFLNPDTIFFSIPFNMKDRNVRPPWFMADRLLISSQSLQLIG